MNERKCGNCIYGTSFERYGIGICVRTDFFCRTWFHGVCRNHRYNDDDEGDTELLFMPQSL